MNIQWITSLVVAAVALNSAIANSTPGPATKTTEMLAVPKAIDVNKPIIPTESGTPVANPQTACHSPAPTPSGQPPSGQPPSGQPPSGQPPSAPVVTPNQPHHDCADGEFEMSVAGAATYCFVPDKAPCVGTVDESLLDDQIAAEFSCPKKNTVAVIDCQPGAANYEGSCLLEEDSVCHRVAPKSSTIGCHTVSKSSAPPQSSTNTLPTQQQIPDLTNKPDDNKTNQLKKENVTDGIKKIESAADPFVDPNQIGTSKLELTKQNNDPDKSDPGHNDDPGKGDPGDCGHNVKKCPP